MCIATVVERSRTSERFPGSRKVRVTDGPSASRHGETDCADRLFLGSPAGAGDSGDGDRGVGVEPLQCAGGHRLGHRLGDRAVRCLSGRRRLRAVPPSPRWSTPPPRLSRSPTIPAGRSAAPPAARRCRIPPSRSGGPPVVARPDRRPANRPRRTPGRRAGRAATASAARMFLRRRARSASRSPARRGAGRW